MKIFWSFLNRALIAGVLTLSALAFASSKSHTTTVIIENMKFTPAEFEVKKGETIVWINKDLVPHTVTSNDKSFDSKIIDPGKSWQLKNSKVGTYAYKCLLHPTMLGSLVVK